MVDLEPIALLLDDYNYEYDYEEEYQETGKYILYKMLEINIKKDSEFFLNIL